MILLILVNGDDGDRIASHPLGGPGVGEAAQVESKPSSSAARFLPSFAHSSKLGSLINEETRVLRLGFCFFVAGTGLEPATFGL